MKESQEPREGTVKQGSDNNSKLNQILSLIEDIIDPDELDIISSRAMIIKKDRLGAMIEKGDLVVISRKASKLLYYQCGDKPQEVIDTTSDGMLILNINGSRGKISRDKVLLYKKAGV